jgi:hypothetical protein
MGRAVLPQGGTSHRHCCPHSHRHGFRRSPTPETVGATASRLSIFLAGIVTMQRSLDDVVADEANRASR